MNAPETPTGKKKLNLKRDTVQNLNDQLLSSQGHSLWTCDESEQFAQAQLERRG
jgi:hypothetical protein